MREYLILNMGPKLRFIKKNQIRFQLIDTIRGRFN